MKKTVFALTALAFVISGSSVLASDHKVDGIHAAKTADHKKEHAGKAKGAKKTSASSTEGQNPTTSSP